MYGRLCSCCVQIPNIPENWIELAGLSYLTINHHCYSRDYASSATVLEKLRRFCCCCSNSNGGNVFAFHVNVMITVAIISLLPTIVIKYAILRTNLKDLHRLLNALFVFKSIYMECMCEYSVDEQEMDSLVFVLFHLSDRAWVVRRWAGREEGGERSIILQYLDQQAKNAD